MGAGSRCPLCPQARHARSTVAARPPERRSLTLDLLVPHRLDGHFAVDRVVQVGDGLAGGGAVDDVDYGLVRDLPEEGAAMLVDGLTQGGGEVAPGLFVSAAASTYWTPEPPGPPGLTKRLPAA